MERFEGKTAFITGGASGMGKAAAWKLAKEGGRIIIADYNKEKATQLVNQMKGEGIEAYFIQVDLNDYSSISLLGKQVKEITDSVNALINSAGIASSSSVDSVSPSDWEKITNINLKAPLYVAVELLELLKKEGASIIKIASDGGLKARAVCPIYDATKAGLISLSKSMTAGYVKYGIRLNALAPGWTVTEFHYGNEDNKELKREELTKMDTDYCLMRRLALPEEIASTIAFLASDDASYVTGAIINVDGGRVGF